mmetsp:Transcript_18691/g.33776  ORF Transcript_18691/g.33776 Transcript_18691/m.33776 type:complete len:140 (+) Transcript_18691:99-518(+)
MDAKMNRDQRLPLATAGHSTGMHTLEVAEEAALAVELDAHEQDAAMQAEAIKRVSEEAAELQQVVLQISQLAKHQGDMIDSIESSLYDAEAQTSHAQEEVQVTEQEIRKQTKRACAAFLVALLLGAVTSIVVLWKADFI